MTGDHVRHGNCVNEGGRHRDFFADTANAKIGKRFSIVAVQAYPCVRVAGSI